MARIKYIEDNEVKDPKVKEAYDRMIKKRGKVTHIYKALAYKPSIISSIGPFVAAVQEPDELDPKLKECQYKVNMSPLMQSENVTCNQIIKSDRGRFSTV